MPVIIWRGVCCKGRLSRYFAGDLPFDLLRKLKVKILQPIDHLSDVMLGDLAEDLLPYFKMESDHK
jgi:hypothetical protein